MTEALKAMVEAMIAEMRAQDVLFEWDPEEGTDPKRVMFSRGIALDLEKVARAGLLAIREPDMTVTLAMREAARAQFDMHQAYQALANSMIDAITKEGE